MINKPAISHLVFILLLFFIEVNAQEIKKSKHVFSTNILSAMFTSELNLNYEIINAKQNQGFEIGYSRLYPSNLIVLGSQMFGFRQTWTRGGDYGLSNVNRVYKLAHIGHALTFNYKKYSLKKFFFYGPQIVVVSRQLLNGFYSNHDIRQAPNPYRGYYWYVADHYNTKIGTLLNLGRVQRIKSKHIFFEYGCAIGLNFNFDKMIKNKWGSYTFNPNPNFNLDVLRPKITRQTDGFYLNLACRAFAKISLLF